MCAGTFCKPPVGGVVLTKITLDTAADSRLLATKMQTTERRLKATCIQLRLESDKFDTRCKSRGKLEWFTLNKEPSSRGAKGLVPPDLEDRRLKPEDRDVDVEWLDKSGSGFQLKECPCTASWSLMREAQSDLP